MRSGALQGSARTQSSIAVNSGNAWVLVNASPDIRAQLMANPELQPGRRVRDSAIVGVVLVDSQIDHTTGLLLLRESTKPLPIWCTDSTYFALSRGNPVLDVLSHYCGVARQRIDVGGAAFAIDPLQRVRWQALHVASKPAPYSPNRESPNLGDNLALVISNVFTKRYVVYAPGLAAVDEALWAAMASASCVLVDGTFWDDDEMIRLGVSGKRARDIGHLAQSGPGGMLEWLKRLPATTRKILIHINNTNPILNDRSAQRAELARLGVEIAWDGMEIPL